MTLDMPVSRLFLFHALLLSGLLPGLRSAEITVALVTVEEGKSVTVVWALASSHLLFLHLTYLPETSGMLAT